MAENGSTNAMSDKHYLIVDLLRAFYWFDDGLQNYLLARGWPTVPRTQSMILMNVISGINRSAEIARNLGVTRQAIHTTISQMVESGLVALENDPTDGRSKCVVLAASLEPMRQDARVAVDLLTSELASRVGEREVKALTRIFDKDWGPTPTFEGIPHAPAGTAKPAAKPRSGKASPGSRRTAAATEG